MYDSIYEVPGIGKYTEIESRIEVIRVRGRGRWGVIISSTELLFGMMTKFWKWVVVAVA